MEATLVCPMLFLSANALPCRPGAAFSTNKKRLYDTTAFTTGKFYVLFKRKMRRPYKTLNHFSTQTRRLDSHGKTIHKSEGTI